MSVNEPNGSPNIHPSTEDRLAGPKSSKVVFPSSGPGSCFLGTVGSGSLFLRAVGAWLAEAFLTESVYKVDLHKSISAQINQLILYISNNKG